MTTAMIANGLKIDKERFEKKKLTIRFTSDELGESLSISDDKEIMLQIPFEGVEQIISIARKKKGKK